MRRPLSLGSRPASVVAGAILLLALVIRLGIIFATPHFTPATDALDWDRHAVSLADHGTYPQTVLAAGGGPTAFRPPGFPAALAAVYKVVGTGDEQTRWEAGRIFEALLGVLAVALTGLIALRLFGRRHALVAAGIAAVYAPLMLVGSSLMAESLYIPLVLGAVLSALVYRDSPKWRWLVLAGSLAGLAALTRSNGAVLLIPLALLVWNRKPRWSRNALAAPLTVLLVAGLTLVPWTIRNANVVDAFIPITDQSGYALAGTFNDVARHYQPYSAFWLPPGAVPELRPLVTDTSLNEVELSAKLKDKGIDYAKDNLSYIPQVIGINVLRLLHLTGTGIERFVAPFQGYPEALAVLSVYAFWLLALIAFAGVRTAAIRTAPKTLWLAAVFLGFSSVLFLGMGRYRVPADPILILVAAAGVIALWDRYRNRDDAIVAQAMPHSMTGEDRLRALVGAVRKVVADGVPGGFAECGVWRGGSVVAILLTLKDLGVTDRDVYLYDTFEGMTAPTEHDVSAHDPPASETWNEAQAAGAKAWPELFDEQVFNEADVRATVLATGYPAERIHFVKGPVEDTIPGTLPGKLALLRLDTDWYESTRHELEHLYPLLSPGGALIIDDYGHWQGAARAVDEYFAAHPPAPQLAEVDYTCRLAFRA